MDPRIVGFLGARFKGPIIHRATYLHSSGGHALRMEARHVSGRAMTHGDQSAKTSVASDAKCIVASATSSRATKAPSESWPSLFGQNSEPHGQP
jgi:hypothetical protein